MATKVSKTSSKKKTTKKTAQKKALTKAEYDKLFDLIGRARVHAARIADNADKRSDVRTAMKSVEKKLFAIGNDYYWGKLTDYAAGAY